VLFCLLIATVIKITNFQFELKMEKVFRRKTLEIQKILIIKYIFFLIIFIYNIIIFNEK